MKKLALFSSLCALALAQINKPEIDLKFEQIAKQRVTISAEEISTVSNPIYMPEVKGNKETVAVAFSLQAVVADRAKINGRWFKKGEEVAAGFKLVSVRNGVVGLSDLNNYKELNLKDKNVTVIKK